MSHIYVNWHCNTHLNIFIFVSSSSPLANEWKVKESKGPDEHVGGGRESPSFVKLAHVD